jgi:hypothetical protein
MVAQQERAAPDYTHAMQHLLDHGRLGLMVVLRNEDRWDRSNVVLDGAYVRTYALVHPCPQGAWKLAGKKGGKGLFAV